MKAENKNLLIINQYASTPAYSSGAGERFYYLAPFFEEEGFKVDVLSGGYNHLFVSYPVTPRLFNAEKIPGGTFYWVRMRRYKGESLAGRLYSWFDFLFKLFFFKIKQPPGIVVVSSMSLFSFLYGYYLKRKYKSKLILEIRDIWPLTIIELGGKSPRHPFIRVMRSLEKFAYRKSDVLVSVLPDFKLHVEQSIGPGKKVYWIPNAISDREDVQTNEKKSDDQPGKYFDVLYTGALGIANAMEYVVAAAAFLKDTPDIRIIIVGEGPEKEKLQVKAAELGLNNIVFRPKVRKTEIPGILSKADACIISWHNRNIYTFGTSANKYNDYMLAKKPVISASNMQHDPVKLAGAGIQVMPENPGLIAEAIKELYKSGPSARMNMGLNGWNYLMANHTYACISKKYIELFNSD